MNEGQMSKHCILHRLSDPASLHTQHFTTDAFSIPLFNMLKVSPTFKVRYRPPFRADFRPNINMWGKDSHPLPTSSMRVSPGVACRLCREVLKKATVSGTIVGATVDEFGDRVLFPRRE